MQKTILFLLWTVITLQAFARSETEPNNSFATATNFPFPVDYLATITSSDVDYHRVNLTFNCNFYLLVEATNNGSNAGFLTLEMYDSRQGTGLIHTRNIGNTLTVSAGETVYDTIYICAKAIDNYYLKFIANEDFDYELKWYPVGAYNTEEPNNTSAAAVPFGPINVEKAAAIGPEFRGGINDTEDWFTSGTLPAGDYSNVKLYLQATNARCSGVQTNISYQVFKVPNLVTPFAQGFIGNTSSVGSGFVVNSEVPLNNMQAGDVFYVRKTAAGPFGYTLRYSNYPPFNDDEDNCCYFNALPLTLNNYVGGKVGEYDYVNDEYIDQHDAYRVILPHDRGIKLFVVGETAEGGIQEPFLAYDILDKFGNELETGKPLIQWAGTPAFGEIPLDTIKIGGFKADTFYLRIFHLS